jgi:peptidoglycan/LPS O-acetylase OafA/YrhL
MGQLKSGDSPNLDLLRSFAVLAVLVDHTAGTFGIAHRYPLLFALGRWGVLLFFVHTSLVLMMSLGRLQLSGWKLFTTFYLRRFFRIYPLSMVAVAVTLVAQVPFSSWALTYEPPSRGTILANFLLVQNLAKRPDVIGPLWSLPYEVQMYILLPVLFLLFRKPFLKPFMGIWIVSVVLGLLQPLVADSALGPRFWVDRLGIAEFIPCFLAGVLAYQLSLREKKPSQPFLAWVFTLGLVTIVYLLWEGGAGSFKIPEWVCCLAIGLVVMDCAESTYSGLNRLTHLIAKYSYGIYLGQVAILWLVFVKMKTLPLSLQWSVFLFLIVAAPFAAYRLVEKPFIRFGKFLTTQAPGICDEKFLAGTEANS